ncbi:Histidinol-phosphatase [Mycoplasma todarodis]
MEWKKIDLHHHTSNDLDAARHVGLKDYQKILDTFNEEEGSLLAITNHDYIDTLEKEKYDEYIKVKKYGISVLHGVEISFELIPKTDKKPKKTGHIIFIFDGTKEQCERINEEVFKNKLVYQKNSAIKEGLNTVLNEIKKHDVPFYAMPHFHKGSENLEYETIPEEFYKSIISFDLLEGKYNSSKNKKSVDQAIKFINDETGIKPGVILGTDAHDYGEFENAIKTRVPWVYIENTFYGIEQLIRFNETRVKFGEKPSSIQNYIKSFTLDEKKLRFDRGLNTIIGRRGTGKSFLLDSLKEAIKNESNSLEFYGAKIILNDILYMKQNQLTENITDVLKIAYEEKSNELNLINESGLSEIDLDNDAPKKSLGELLTIMSEGLSSAKKVVEEGIETKKFENLIQIKNSIYDSISQENTHIVIEKDLSVLKAIKEEEKSVWLAKKLSVLEEELNLYSDSPFVKQSRNNDKIIKSIKALDLTDFNTAKDSISSKFESFAGEVLTKWTTLEKDLNKITQAFLKIADIYLKYSAEQIVNSITTKKPVLTKQTIKINTEDVGVMDFTNEVISIFYKKNNFIKDATYTSFLNLTKRRNKKNIDDLFVVNFKHFIDDVNIDELSIGQKHQKLLENILLNDKKIIFLDQPDDDLDAITIQEQIVDKLTKWNVSKQVIIVSHDPKIVINSDSKEIILANYKGDSQFGEENYKNVDFKDIKENVYKILDAKKQYPYIRFKEYGGYDGN